jgi:transcriptional regulator with XRE-family HTH domain
MSETDLQRAIKERQARQRAAIGMEIKRALAEANISLRALAAGCGIDVGHLSRVLAGDASLSQDALVAVATALGCDASLKLFRSTGPRVRDRLQVRMLEAILADLHARWVARLEIPVWRPARGVIDLVLRDRLTGDLVAGEGQSLLHAVEAQLRHAHEKTDSLPSASGWPWQDRIDAPRTCRLLVLRSCPAMHDLVRALPMTFRTAYPGDTREAVAALRGATQRFPDAAIVWVSVDGARTRLLDGLPRALAR